MVSGAHGQHHHVLRPAVMAYNIEKELATTLHLLTAEKIVKVLTTNRQIVIQEIVQVIVFSN